MTAYPNPSRGQFSLQLRGFSEGTTIVMIADSYGKTVLTQDVLIGSKTLVASFGVQNLPAGVYNIRASNGKQVQ